ncbi:MAG: hypothetical protein IJ647_00850 [Prevotella sp.]|nr:hypothetical protein [Prevotella sp.]
MSFIALYSGIRDSFFFLKYPILKIDYYFISKVKADLKNAFPEMHGFSPRNLKYMRRFAEVWPDETIVQRTVAQNSLPPATKKPSGTLSIASPCQ